MNPQGYPQQGYPQQPPGYPPPQGYSAPQGPPPKKGMNGCLLAALIVGAIGIVVAAVAGIFIYKAAKAITQVAEEGLNAPGSAELRAAGCEAAVVMDLSRLSSLFDAGSTAPGQAPGIVISCATSPAKKAPTCDDLAKTYVKAVGSPGTEFIVQVQPQGGGKPDCKKVYSSKGTFVRDER